MGRKKPQYRVVAEYQMRRAPYDFIIMVRLEKLARRQHVSSGGGMGARDVSWDFKTKAGAINTAKRIRKDKLKYLKVYVYGPEGLIL